uniref:Uncharacterized protein n=1 Tax=Knipowitschia caucasica TaxID=637954 RepID=A0AAV2K1K8_KNICA
MALLPGKALMQWLCGGSADPRLDTKAVSASLPPCPLCPCGSRRRTCPGQKRRGLDTAAENRGEELFVIGARTAALTFIFPPSL